eukprot:TRINITY_DN172_c0_g1_i10.p2 TRINITY_DN172_c0_g1~~TRINITY_DN172_c0_g1_i10.p2  ORF type:complete len:474 (-),score=69.37 TRINITY_DN172_c0_g1_i10:14676-16097(-)
MKNLINQPALTMKRELEEVKTSIPEPAQKQPIPEPSQPTTEDTKQPASTPKQTPPQNPNRDRSKKKQKLIMIIGYNGLGFIGSQKQPGDIRTVEGEIEKALYQQGYIAESNYGTLQKISFSRATRTDKRVHALQNFFACKFLLDPSIKDLKVHKERIAAALPKDMKLFTLLEGAKRFNTKLRCSAREYLYYLPSFCLWKDGKGKPMEENYSYKATGELLEKLEKICAEFKGTHRFHNYTKYIDPKQMQSNRHIFEMSAKPSLTIDGVEFIEVFIKGQSFLYNQIRKMIGMIISVCRKDQPIEVIYKSFSRHERMSVPLAPGEGLMLNRVLYDGYNKMKGSTKVDVEVPKEDQEEIEKFKAELIQCIGKQETEGKVFSQWLEMLDEEKEDEHEKEDEKEYKENNNAEEAQKTHFIICTRCQTFKIKTYKGNENHTKDLRGTGKRFASQDRLGRRNRTHQQNRFVTSRFFQDLAK